METTATFFPRGEARAQELRYPGLVCPDTALTLAVDAILLSNAPESLSDVRDTLGLSSCSAHCYFNRQTSLFGLVADEHSAIRSRFLPGPPNGAALSDYWVFFLSVPDLDEHGYWALVARDGSGVETLAQN